MRPATRTLHHLLRPTLPLATAVAAVACITPWARATNFVWKAPSISTWSTAGNWNPSGPPTAADSIVNPTTNASLQLDTAHAEVTNLTFDYTGSWGITGVNAGTSFTISNQLTKAGTQTLTIRGNASNGLDVSIGSLSISGGRLQLGDRAVPANFLSSLSIGSASLTGGQLLLTVGPDTGNTAVATINGALTLSGGSGVYIRENVGSSGTLSVGSLVSSDTTAIVSANEFTGSTSWSNGTLILNNASGNIATFAGQILPGKYTSITSVTKQGLGTQIFSGSLNTYTGATTVSAGALLFTNTTGSGSGTGAITVGANGTLGGTGHVAPTGANAISIAGNLSPGTSATPIGVFDINLGGTSGKMTLQSGATLKADLGTAGATISAFGSSDLLKITGAAAGDVTFTNTAIDCGGTGATGWYKLFDTDLGSGSTWSGLTLSGQQIVSGLSLTNLPAGASAKLFVGNGTTGNYGDIYAQISIPEPATLSVLLLCPAALLVRRRAH